METNDLINEMKAVKQANETLTVSEVLTIFQIQALQELSIKLNNLTAISKR